MYVHGFMTGLPLFQVSDWQTQVASQESEKVALQLELTSHTEELETLREDVKRYLDAASSTQSLYQRELLQHSKSMENLVATQDKVHVHTFYTMDNL